MPLNVSVPLNIRSLSPLRGPDMSCSEANTLQPVAYIVSWSIPQAMNPPPNREIAIFSAALEMEASRRAAYLDQACADDPKLRLHLEALLRVHEEAKPFL